jgi:hypothetical protein
MKGKSWAELPIDLDSIAIETRVVRDIATWMDRTRAERCWRQVSAPSGAGKSHSLAFLTATRYAGRQDPTGLTIAPVLDIVSPHEATRAAARLRERIAIRLGAVVSRRQTDIAWIAAELWSCGVELLVLDDSHKLALEEQIPVIKELSDLYAQHAGGRRFGVLFLAATARGESLLRTVFENRDPDEYAQYLGRMAPEERYLTLRGLSEADVREALAGYEAHFRAAGLFPDLRLVPFTRDMNRYLRMRPLAPSGPGFVLMRSVRWYVEAILRRLVARGLTDIDARGDLIEEVGQALLRSSAWEPQADGDESGAEGASGADVELAAGE